MKVDQTKSSPIQSGEAHATRATQGAKKAQGAKSADKSTEARAGSAAAAKTEVSDKAREMAKAKQVAGEAPDVREEKIAALKARIAEGRYKVDANAVADRMVDEHIRMSGIG